MLVSIIVPVIREEKALSLLDRVRETVGIHEDQYEIVCEEDLDRIGCPKMVKSLVEKADGQYVCFLGDDSWPSQDFIKKALEYPDGLVAFNDGTYRELPTHWFAPIALRHLLGGEFFHTGYKHCYCDNELMERCKELNLFQYAKDILVEHNHPLFKHDIQTDPDYERVYSQEYLRHDSKLFEERKKNGWKS